jgi:hypothetical protein
VLNRKTGAMVVTPFRRRPLRVAPLALLLALLLGAGLAKAGSIVNGKGVLRVAVDGKLAPHTLPRTGSAPVAVSVSGEISTTDGSQPPTLEKLVIEINRHGQINPRGLPICRGSQLQASSNSRALKACRSSLVGEGKFFGTIALPGQPPYPMAGRLLVFNGEERGRPVLLGHIFSPHPFATAFVIPFQIATKHHGNYGTTLVANVAKALGHKRNLTKIEMTLSRRYDYHGERRSFVTAGCPAPKGFSSVNFPLARTSFSFAGATKITSVLMRTCGARG